VIIRIRHAARATVDLTVYAGRSGHLWMPLVVVVLAVAAALVVVVKTVVPTAVYVLF
jgi:hypothetical protein